MGIGRKLNQARQIAAEKFKHPNPRELYMSRKRPRRRARCGRRNKKPPPIGLEENHFSEKMVAGTLKPYPISAHRIVPAHIDQPDWAIDGIPKIEPNSELQNIVEVLHGLLHSCNNTEICASLTMRTMGDLRQFDVEAKSFEVQRVGLHEGFALKITEKNKKGFRSTLWVPEEAICWMERSVKELSEAKGYCFRKFRGRKCSLVGERRSNVRGEFLIFQAYLGFGAGGRIIIPKGIRRSGWDALITVLGSPYQQTSSNRGKEVDMKLHRSAWSEPMRLEPRVGLECHIERDKAINKVVVDLDAGVFHEWAAAVVCSIGGPQQTDDWEEVAQIIVFRWVIAIVWVFVVGGRRQILSFTGLRKPRWVAVKGIPFHLWVPNVLGKIGAICGGLVEVHPSTVARSDLSFAKIKVAGDLNFVPRVITIVFHSISYPLEIYVWEEELCENCQMWPDSMEIRYSRSWVEVNDGASVKTGPRVNIGLDKSHQALSSNSNLNVECVKRHSNDAPNSGEYKPTRQVVREESSTLPTNLASCKTSVKQPKGIEKHKRKNQVKNRKRNGRRLRLRWQRRIVEYPPPVGGSDVLDGGRLEPRASGVRGAEDDDHVSPLSEHVSVNKGWLGGPSLDEPLGLGQAVLGTQLDPVHINPPCGPESQPTEGLVRSPGSDRSDDPFGLYPLIVKSNKLHSIGHFRDRRLLLSGEEGAVQGEMVDGLQAISLLLRKIQVINQRQRVPSLAVNMSEGSESVQGREFEAGMRGTKSDLGVSVVPRVASPSIVTCYPCKVFSGDLPPGASGKRSVAPVEMPQTSSSPLAIMEMNRKDVGVSNSLAGSLGPIFGEVRDYSAATVVLKGSEIDTDARKHGDLQALKVGPDRSRCHQAPLQNDDLISLPPLIGRLWVENEDPTDDEHSLVSEPVVLDCLDPTVTQITVGSGRVQESAVKEVMSGTEGYLAEIRGNIVSLPPVSTTEAAEIARVVLDAAARVIRPGVTTDEIDEVVHKATIDAAKRKSKNEAMIAAGIVAMFYCIKGASMALLTSICIANELFVYHYIAGGYPSPLNYNNFPKSCCTSVNEVICHGIPDGRRLEDGDIVNVDVTVYYKGVHGDLNETYFVGKVDEGSQQLVQCTYECLEKAISIVKPGVRFREVGEVINRHASMMGFSVVKSYCGHGIGELFHCAPNIPHYGRNKAVGVMKVGQTFTIEPMINAGVWHDRMWPDGWTAVTADGKRSAQFEHTLLVTATGVEVLTARLPSSPNMYPWLNV
ncbi:hypothetical protein HHK36_028709 [Tetracentron sinense]|uniref:Methionine aminopeptidase n=2 Tax=Magnoliopsida TaxID=3398 RepID=A0A834YFX0_TETSI|nr:hypothetical protein HHK36_028709 [Tetracentron sinense]